MKYLLPTAAASALLTLLCIVALDEPFARWIATRETYPAFWNETIGYLEYAILLEPYKWGTLWLLAGGAIITLAVPPLRRYSMAFLLVSLVHLLGRNITNWTKFFTGRLRPSQWLAKGGDDPMWWNENAWSFPSGHVTLFASIAIPLAVLYPRLRPPLLVVAVFPMCARVAVNAHYLSDVLGALALITALTWLCARLLVRALPSPSLPASLR